MSQSDGTVFFSAPSCSYFIPTVSKCVRVVLTLSSWLLVVGAKITGLKKMRCERGRRGRIEKKRN